MTINELIAELQRLKEEGVSGDTEVSYSMDKCLYPIRELQLVNGGSDVSLSRLKKSTEKFDLFRALDAICEA